MICPDQVVLQPATTIHEIQKVVLVNKDAYFIEDESKCCYNDFMVYLLHCSTNK